MQEFLGSTRAMAKGGKPTVLVFNPSELTLDDRKIVVERTNDGGYLCVGFGSAAQFLRAVDDDADFGKVVAGRTPRGRDPFLSRLTAAVALAKDYDPEQPRDANGRWTGGGIAGSTAATADALFGNSALVPALREIGERVLGALPAIPEITGAAVVGAALTAGAFFGTLFFPTSGGAVSDGTLPDARDFSYHFDQGTGVLIVSRRHDDGTSETVFSGRHDADGVFRDEDHNAIGRHLGSSVALDADAIRGYEARAKSNDQSSAGTNAQAGTASNRNDPKICPAPGPDKPGNKSPGAIAYQMYVGIVVNKVPLPPGIGIKVIKPDGDPVYFDDCRRSNGALIEAKGMGYADALRNPNTPRGLNILERFAEQSARQVEAAQGRPIEWHFAEEEPADYIRTWFARDRPSITVFYTPPPKGLIGDLKRMLEGEWNELRYFPGMFSRRQAASHRAQTL